jgi:hypothetical protein
VDLNLDTLKREIEEYLNASGFAVFHSVPGGLEGQPLVLWDSQKHPDYQMFLDVAQRAGVSLILFATREFETADLDETLEQVEACDLTREERRDFESRLRELKAYEGVTCSLELAFEYNSRVHVYEVQPDWYEEFLGIEEELMAHMSDEDEADDSLGGYFSKN